MAHDPILAQEITNGHAARMRYSRFRSAMLGLEPQRRNRTSANKSRVSKSKKEPKSKKATPGIKQDPVAPNTSVKEESKVLSPKVKQEHVQALPESTSSDPTAGLASSAVPPSDLHSQLHARLLTPCSDSDVLVASQCFAASPNSDMLHSDASFDLSGPSQYSHHDHTSWSRAQTYPAFGVGYDLVTYTTGFCEHQHNHQAADELAFSGGLLDGNGNHVMVKHEEWDAQSYQ